METAKDHTDSLKQGQKVALTASLLILFFLLLSKFIIGTLFDSRILIADACP